MSKFQSWCVIIVMLMSLLMTSCQKIPQEVIDSAISYHDTVMCQNYECRDTKIGKVKQKNITDADKANGIDAAWCVEISYISQLKAPYATWQNATDVIYVRHSSDELIPWNGGTWDYCMKDNSSK